jgi:hypothetical protein
LGLSPCRSELKPTWLLSGRSQRTCRQRCSHDNEKRIDYENAVIDHATRLASANSGTASDLIEWSRSGGSYKQRANLALRDWIANGYKEEVENAQATVSHILGGNMVAWKEKLTQDPGDIQNNVQGASGYQPAAASPDISSRKVAEHDGPRQR